jgi:hypothetical protein
MSNLTDAIDSVSVQIDTESNINLSALNADFFGSQIISNSEEKTDTKEEPKEQSLNEPIKTNTGEGRLDSRVVISFFDVVFSRLLQFGCSMGGIEVSAKELTLTPDEIKKIEPVASVIIDKYAVGMSPEVMLATLLLTIYGAKIMIALPEGKAKGTAKKAKIDKIKSSTETGNSDTKQTYAGARRGPKVKVKETE